MSLYLSNYLVIANSLTKPNPTTLKFQLKSLIKFIKVFLIIFNHYLMLGILKTSDFKFVVILNSNKEPNHCLLLFLNYKKLHVL